MNLDIDDFDTTTVRRGEAANTFSALSEFADGLRQRPLDKLLLDLPGLAGLSDQKFRLASHVIRQRWWHLPSVEQDQLVLIAEEVAAGLDAETAERVRDIFRKRHP